MFLLFVPFLYYRHVMRDFRQLILLRLLVFYLFVLYKYKMSKTRTMRRDEVNLFVSSKYKNYFFAFRRNFEDELII